jgi:hypothetical protein
MSQTEIGAGGRRHLLGRRNLVALGAGVAFLVAGYVLLGAGSTSLAAVLLVLGYCVLFPLAIAL